MIYVVYFLAALQLNEAFGQEVSTTTPASSSENATPMPQNTSESTTAIFMQDDPVDENDEPFTSDDVSSPEVILDSASGIDIPKDQKIHNKFYYKPVSLNLFQKFSPVHLLRPVQEKWEKIKEFLAYTKHPNYGGVQFLSPQDIWERLHEKGHNFLTGINGAVYGLTNSPNYDYPFAYRELKRTRRASIKEMLANYKETVPFAFKYDVPYEKIGQDNKSYKFSRVIDKINLSGT